MGIETWKSRVRSVLILLVFGAALVTSSPESAKRGNNLREPKSKSVTPPHKSASYSEAEKPSPPRIPRTARQSRRTATEFLSSDYYRKSCPQVESIVHNKMRSWVAYDFTLAASLIRLHFHDCFVRGCDASILLGYRGSERDSAASKTLRGFEVVDDIKLAVERACPRVVSCADILTTIARDATILVGGPFWAVPFGRKDGRVSRAKEANLVPGGHENVTVLIELFQSKGLNILDLVVLSGGHTVGRGSCGVIRDRLYNYNNTRKPDLNIDPTYLNLLQRNCRWERSVPLDPTTPDVFDAAYYTNLQKKKGLLVSDESLYLDGRTRSLVDTFASQPSLFFQQFAVSMVRLGNLQVLTGSEGEVRTNCNFLNH